MNLSAILLSWITKLEVEPYFRKLNDEPLGLDAGSAVLDGLVIISHNALTSLAS